MENHPDSAYSLLQTIDSEALRTRGGRARYALLYTQAQDKNYIDHSNDSLITIAADYYREHGDEHTRFLSLYYKGRIHYNAGDYLHAMLNYSEAETLVPDLRDDYYAGLLYSQIGSIYRKFYDFPKSLEAYQKAEVCYRNAGRDYHRLFAMTDQSVVYRNVDNYVKSDSLLQVVLVEAIHEENHTLIDYTMGNLLMQYVEQGYMKNAKSIYERMLKDYGLENNTSYFLTSVIKIHLYDGEYQDAERMLHKAWTQAKTANDSVACYFASSQIYKERRLFDKALQEHESGILIQNRIVKQNLQQPVLTIQRDYLAQELEHQAYKRKMNRILSVVTVLFIIVCAFFMFYFLLKRIRRYYRKSLYNKLKQQEEKYRHQIERLWEEVTIQKDVLLKEENRQHLEQCFILCRTYFKTLDKMYDIYNNPYANNKKKFETIDAFLLKFTEKYTKGKKGYALLESMINENMNNVMMHLRAEVKLPDEEYYQQICFHIAGFSGNTIARIFKTTANAIYKRKDRILEKIFKDNPMYLELFTMYIFK